jgi:hypothetical protein
MPRNFKPHTLADPKRFRTIQDLTKLRPDCGAAIDDMLIIDNEFLLIIDLIRIGNLLNPYNSPSASYVRTHGVIVAGHSRDAACPVLWDDPFLLLVLSSHLDGKTVSYSGVGEVVGNVSCPGGAFLFLPVQKEIPKPLNSLLDEVLTKEAGVKIKLPEGTYRVFYEQFEVPAGTPKEYYQNIVVQRQ